MKINKILWGLFFIAAAALIVLNQLGFSTGVSLWGLLITVILIPVIFFGLAHRNFFNFFFGIAFLLIVYQHPLGIQSLVPWTVLAAALLLSIGFAIIFKPKNHHGSCWNGHWGGHSSNHDYSETTEHVDIDGNEINFSTSLAGSVKYLHSDSLQRGNLECSLGYLKVYFDNVELHPDGADLYVNCSLGSMELFIPRHWTVMLNVEATLGSVEEMPRRENTCGPTLRITGSVSLGALEIKYF